MSETPASVAESQAAAAIIMEQLLTESTAMLRHAMSSGLPVPADAVNVLTSMAYRQDARRDASAGALGPWDAESVRLLTAVHTTLAALIAPATPRVVVLLADDQGASRKWILGRIPLVRRMLLMAMGSLAAFVLLSVLPYANMQGDGDILNSRGVPLLISELFFLSAAAMGASVALLSMLSQEVQAANFDPHHEPLYWLKFVLGLIAGLLLATLVEVDASSLAQPGNSSEMASHFSSRVTSALLALLGGFSAQPLYRILTRLSTALELLFTGIPATRAEEGESQGRASGRAPAGRDSHELARLVRELLARPEPTAAPAPEATPEPTTEPTAEPGQTLAARTADGEPAPDAEREEALMPDQNNTRPGQPGPVDGKAISLAVAPPQSTAPATPPAS